MSVDPNSTARTKAAVLVAVVVIAALLAVFDVITGGEFSTIAIEAIRGA